MSVLRTVRAVATKELRQIRRDRRTLMVLLLLPAMLLLLYGYALNFDIRHITLAVQDNDRTTASRELISAFVNSGYFDLIGEMASDADIRGTVNRDEARTVLVIPARFGRDVATGRPTDVQLLVNGDNANTATTAVAYATALVGGLSTQYELQIIRRGGLSIARTDAGGLEVEPAMPSAVSRIASPQSQASSLLSLEPRVWYNPELRSALFLVPGLIAYIAMLTAVVSTALSIVREKESGTMEQVRMSPIGPFAYVVGKTVPYFIISLASALSIVVLAMLLFQLPMRGSWMALLGAVSLFLIAALAIGLLISAIADTQQVAFQLALLTSFLPTLMLSGFIFPISSMPTALQIVTYGVPARYFLEALRSIILKGVGASLIWFDLVALAGFALLILTLASMRLRRQWA